MGFQAALPLARFTPRAMPAKVHSRNDILSGFFKRTVKSLPNRGSLRLDFHLTEIKTISILTYLKKLTFS
jgi:hypothetical protein